MAETDTVATSTIAVHRGAWSDPTLAAMVAPPVIVSSMPVEHPTDAWRRMETWRRAQLARSRGNMPIGRHRRPPR